MKLVSRAVFLLTIAAPIFTAMADGERVQTSERLPRRVISLSPAITELIFELDAANLLVGTSEYSDHPAAAKKLPRVGSYQRPSIEKILALKPDLVLLPNEGVDTISASLVRFKIPYHVLKTQRVRDYKDAVASLGAWLGRAEMALRVQNNFDTALSSIRSDCKKKRVLLTLEDQPLIAAAADTFLDDGLTRCGCVNALSHRKGYVRLDRESERLLSSVKRVALSMPVPARHLDLLRLGPKFPQALNGLCKELSGEVAGPQ